MKWAEAAHGIPVDGTVWMSRLCNNSKAYVFFGDKCADAFAQDTSHARIFASPADQMWLIDLCAPLHVDANSNTDPENVSTGPSHAHGDASLTIFTGQLRKTRRCEVDAEASTRGSASRRGSSGFCARYTYGVHTA